MIFEELLTLFTQIEAVLNSCRLCALSSDPNEPTALASEHYIIGDSLTSVLEPDWTILNMNTFLYFLLSFTVPNDSASLSALLASVAS